MPLSIFYSVVEWDCFQSCLRRFLLFVFAGVIHLLYKGNHPSLNISLQSVQVTVSPWVSRNYCTRWIPGCDVTNEGLPLQTIAGCRTGPTISPRQILTNQQWAFVGVATTFWDPTGAGICANPGCVCHGNFPYQGGITLYYLHIWQAYIKMGCTVIRILPVPKAY